MPGGILNVSLERTVPGAGDADEQPAAKRTSPPQKINPRECMRVS
jgi:hypothetical protein